MGKQEVIDYVMNSPHNTNRGVLSTLLNSIAEGINLPEVTSEDNGKVLTVVEGNWSAAMNNLVNGSASGSVRGINTQEEDNNYTIGKNAIAQGNATKAVGSASHAEGFQTEALSSTSHAEGSKTRAFGVSSHAEGKRVSDTIVIDEITYNYGATGEASHSEGYNTIAFGEYAHAEGASTKAIGKYSHAEGSITQAMNPCSHAEGAETKATNSYSHVEGYQSKATGMTSHAEGRGTEAIGGNAHSEGYNTKASGSHAHAEGASTSAEGNASHAEGSGTIAKHRSQHVFGAFNVEDASTATSDYNGTYIEIVGNGTSKQVRSNARTLDWDGNEWLAGTLTLGQTTITEAQLQALLELLN